jgi:hypothetical protein
LYPPFVAKPFSANGARGVLVMMGLLPITSSRLPPVVQNCSQQFCQPLGQPSRNYDFVIYDRAHDVLHVGGLPCPRYGRRKVKPERLHTQILSATQPTPAHPAACSSQFPACLTRERR